MRKFFIIMMSAFSALIFLDAAAQPSQARRDNERVIPLTAEEANQRWAEFATAKTADYCMDFTITHYPRRGEESVYDGEIFGAERRGKSFTRIRVKKADSVNFSDFILINSPKESRVWKLEGGKFEMLPETGWFAPMVEGLIYSPFDLLMSYRYWNTAYEGPGRIGQAVHYFGLSAPESAAANVSKIRIALSREFNSPVQTETFAPDGSLLRTLSLGSVKKVDGLWIMLEAEVRDEATRNKDKLRFRAAKLNAILDAGTFDVSDGSKIPHKPELQRL